MSKKILIDSVYPGETRVVIYDKNRIQDFDYENSNKKQLKGNIYLARITRVEPSLQAAFIEYGGDKHGFLPFNEIHPNYFIMNSTDNMVQESSGAVLVDKVSAIILPEISEVEAEEANKTEEAFVQEILPSVEVGAESQLAFAEEEQQEFVAEISADEDASSLEEEIDEAEGSSHHKDFHQKYKIQDVIKKGQVILVQVIKEERGNKGASCTSYISLAGRYCVLMPNSDKQGGISRRIVNYNDRKRLKDVLAHLALPEGVSIILRTAGADKNINDIRRDYYYLARLWNAVREHAVAANVNTFIHAESDLIKRTIRDLYSSEISEILIQGTESYKSAKDFIKKILPLHAHKVKEYRSKVPLFTKYGIEEQITTLYYPTAHLPSGGYIVINPTEALIAIDVNSGKATNEHNIEETATKTNIEAAIEAARQLRLRDLSGLIVIDFIDMMESTNRRLVERTLRDAFQADRAKVQLGNISAFGLLELSRQRLQSSFTECNTVACPACAGKGNIRSFETNALVMLRTIESEIYKGDSEVVNIYAHPDMILHLLNNMRDQLTRLEETHKCKIVLHKENTVYYDGFAIEKTAKFEKSSTRLHEAPKFNDEEYIDSYNEAVSEEAAAQDNRLGLGQDLAPYQVNDDAAMTEAVDSYNRANRNNKFRKGFVGKKRRIGPNASDASEPLPLSADKPAVISQAENNNPNALNRRPNNKRRNNRFNNNRPRRPDGSNPVDAKKSVLQSFWDKLTK